MAASAKVLMTQLEYAWSKMDDKNMAEVESKIQELQMEVASKSFFPTGEISKGDLEMLALQRNLYEKAALFYAKRGDMEKFELSFRQLSFFYDSVKGLEELGNGKSPNEYHIRSLYLMFLLSQTSKDPSRLQTFQTELSKIDHEIREQNVYVKYAEQMQEDFNTGYFHKMWKIVHSAPSEYFKSFTNILIPAAREVIAHNIERTYVNLNFASAIKELLFADSNNPAKDVQDFGKARGWNINPGKTAFIFENEAKKVESAPFPADILAVNGISYAKQLTKIV